MEPLVSVIVPVYRVEKYLEECVNSLLQQTLKNIEIILIDDGSDDNCPALCDRYRSMYAHIKVIHQEKNKGVSSARNAGLVVAKGKYIAFCDSDDTMGPEMLENLYQCAESQNVDIVICGYRTVPDGKTNTWRGVLNKRISPEEFIYSNTKIHSGNDLCFSWRFFIRNCLIKEKSIAFDSVRIGEDFLFNLRCVMEAKSIFVLPKALYNYRIDNENSIMRCKYKSDLEEQIEEQYELKLRMFQQYGLDKNKIFMDDFAFYYVAEWGFAGMLFRNVIAGPKEERNRSFQRIIRLSCLSDNYKRMGKNILMYGKQNAIFWFACKYHIDCLVERLALKIYGK